MAILEQRKIVASYIGEGEEIEVAGLIFKKGVLTETWINEENYLLINNEVQKGNIVIFEYGTGGGGTPQPVDLTELTDIRTDIKGRVFESAVKRIESDYIDLSNLFMLPYMNKKYKYYIGNKIVTTNNTIKGTSTRLTIQGQITKEWLSRANLIAFPEQVVDITECSYICKNDKLTIARLYKGFSGQEKFVIPYDKFPTGKLKVATTYTLSFKSIRNESLSCWFDFDLYFKNSSGTEKKIESLRFNAGNATKINTLTFSTPVSLKDVSYALLLRVDESSSSFSGGKPFEGICELSLREGSYSYNNIPDFVPFADTAYACLGEDDNTDGTDGYTITMQTTSEAGEVSLSSVRLAEPLRAMPDDVGFGESGYDYIQGDVVIRNIGERDYKEGDESNPSVFTDNKKTLYVLPEKKIEKLNKSFNVDTFDGVNTIECLNTLNPFFSLCVPVGEQYTDIDKLKEDIEYIKKKLDSLNTGNPESMIRSFTDSVLIATQVPLSANIEENVDKVEPLAKSTGIEFRTYSESHELLTGSIPLGIEESIDAVTTFKGIDFIGFSETIETTQEDAVTEGDETSGE